MSRQLSSLLVSLLALGLIACGEDSTQPDGEQPSEATPLAVAEAGALELQLFASGPLEVGRNEVAYRLVETATGTAVGRATLEQRPLMKMADHAHACPLTDPPAEADADGYFRGTLIPTMPSGDAGSWSLDVDVSLDGESTPTTFHLGALEISERAVPARTMLKVGEEKYVVTLNFASGAPAVGENPVVVTVHRAAEMGMRFPAQTDLAIRMTPEMPSMGHGSPGNEDPVHVADGDYRGLVNLMMAGDWRITLELSRDGETLGTVVYDFEL